MWIGCLQLLNVFAHCDPQEIHEQIALNETIKEKFALMCALQRRIVLTIKSPCFGRFLAEKEWSANADWIFSLFLQICMNIVYRERRLSMKIIAVRRLSFDST